MCNSQVKKFEEFNSDNQIHSNNVGQTPRGYVRVLNVHNTTNDKLSGCSWIFAWKEYMNSEKHRDIGDLSELICSSNTCNTRLEDEDRAGGHVFVISKDSNLYSHVCIAPICKEHNNSQHEAGYLVKECDLVDRYDLEEFYNKYQSNV